MTAMERRKIEQSLIREKVETKKREKEDRETVDKPKFVTKSYEAQFARNKKRIDLEKN
jgi:coiled-coil domain-containing protein 55